MPTSLRLRSVCVGLAFLFSTSLLYTLSFHRLEGTNPFGPDYHQPSSIARFLNDYTPDVSKNITVPDGQRNHALESLAPVSQHLHVKRDEELLYQFGCLVNKGIKYFEEGIVKGAEDFDNGPQDFGQNPFGDNGWTRDEGKEDTPSIWDDVLKNLPPRKPQLGDYKLITLTQDRAFANVWHPANQVSEPQIIRSTYIVTGCPLLWGIECSACRLIRYFRDLRSSSSTDGENSGWL